MDPFRQDLRDLTRLAELMLQSEGKSAKRQEPHMPDAQGMRVMSTNPQLFTPAVTGSIVKHT
jgi:hypothetical protein